MNAYLILDSRANYNQDDSSIIQIFEADNDADAIKFQKKNYENQKTVLHQWVESDTKLIHADI